MTIQPPKILNGKSTTVSFQGRFAVPLATPYKAGHVCTAAEARALNRARLKLVYDKFYRQASKAALEQLAKLQAHITEFDKDFDLNDEDVLGREAATLARLRAREFFNAQGKDPAKVHHQTFNAEVRRLLATSELQSEAELRYEARLAVIKEALNLGNPKGVA